MAIESDGKLKAATAALTAANEALTVANAEHAKRTDVSKAIDAAVAAADAARQKAVDDVAIAEALKKLQERATLPA